MKEKKTIRIHILSQAVINPEPDKKRYYAPESMRYWPKGMPIRIVQQKGVLIGKTIGDSEVWYLDNTISNLSAKQRDRLSKHLAPADAITIYENQYREKHPGAAFVPPAVRLLIENGTITLAQYRKAVDEAQKARDSLIP